MEDMVLNNDLENEEMFELLGVKMSIKEMDFLLNEQSNGKQLFVENGKVVAKEVSFNQEEVLQNKILKLKNKLVETDYVALKIAEAETEEEKQTLKQKYFIELAQRKQWREEINQLEQQLNN